jgi:hypothetical protein
MRPALYGQAYIFLRQIAHLELQRGRCLRLFFADRFAEAKRRCGKTERVHLQGGGVSDNDRHAGLQKLRVSATVENYFNMVWLIRSLQRLESKPCG